MILHESGMVGWVGYGRVEDIAKEEFLTKQKRKLLWVIMGRTSEVSSILNCIFGL